MDSVTEFDLVCQSAVSQVARSRPARYPPSAKLATAVSRSQSPDNKASATDVSRQVAEGEAMARPIAAPNVMRTKVRADAAMAPAITAPQEM